MRPLKISLAAVLLAVAFAATGTADSPDLEYRFVQLDADSDGFVALGEWTGGPETFDSLDRNGDAVITRTEFFTREVSRYKTREERFKELDADRDGRVSTSEWKWGEQTLSVLDRNRDGFLTRQEFRCRPHTARGEAAIKAGGK
jgi:Ca2+-binding EF-hand superfamily protein